MVLIVGGAGYIGSHINKDLTKKGLETVIFDNFSSGRKELVRWGELVEGDLANIENIREVFKKYPIDGVFHLAASKAVEESVTDPQKYYQNNVVNTLNLFKVMVENKINKVVFSSSAAVYGSPEYLPIDETHPQNPTSPYGQTKLMVEHIMRDYCKAYDFKYVALRYFNVCGADLDGEIGEWPGNSANLIPLVFDAVVGNKEDIKLFGTDYPTPDGTCVRDYIHVTDLAEAHILALEYLVHNGKSDVFNLGNGNGFSVREIVNMTKKVIGRDFKVTEAERRAGDMAELVADFEKSRRILKWKPKYSDLKTIISSAWNWYRNY